MASAGLGRIGMAASRPIAVRRRRAPGWVLAGLLGLAACSDRPEPAALLPDAGATMLSCEADATQARGAEPGVLINNTWNKAAAGTYAWRQCLQTRQREGHTDYGWYWSWPGRDSLYAYPEILIGRSPWRDTPSNDGRFPRTIADTRALWVDYDVESRHSGKRNLALEFWLTRGQPAGSPPDPHRIRNELMIWTEGSDVLVPASERPLATVTIDGVRWALHVKPDWGVVSGGVVDAGSGYHWQLITYHALTPAPAVRYDARKFFADAIERGLLEPTDTIEGVELGTELVSGSGSTWVRRFQLRVE